MFSRQHRRTKALYGLADVVMTALAFEAAYQTRLLLPSLLPLERVFYIIVPVKALLLGFCILAWVLSGIWLGTYERLPSARWSSMALHTLRQCAMGGVALVVFEFLMRLDLSRPFLLLFLTYNSVFLLLFRSSMSGLSGVLWREFAQPHFCLVVGLGECARRVAAKLEASREFGIRLVGFLEEDKQPRPAVVRLADEYPVYPLSSLPTLLREHIVDEVFFAVESHRLAQLEEMLLLCDEEGVRTSVPVDFFPHVHSRVYLDRLSGSPLLTFSATPHDEIRLLLKRVIDVVVAVAALTLLLPVMIIIGLLIKLTSPGPVIFRQVRCGLNGRRFVFYKFRSMCVDAEQRKAELQHLNQKRTAFKIPNDPRLTPIGRWLRKFSIDEWPQLWNVLKGDMSLVGPRPAVPDEVDRYQRWQRRRLRMRPGLTCLWAVNGRDTLDFDTWMKMDMEYIENWSLALDWKIILRTIPSVVTGKGAY